MCFGSTMVHFLVTVSLYIFIKHDWNCKKIEHFLSFKSIDKPLISTSKKLHSDTSCSPCSSLSQKPPHTVCTRISGGLPRSSLKISSLSGLSFIQDPVSVVIDFLFRNVERTFNLKCLVIQLYCGVYSLGNTVNSDTQGYLMEADIYSLAINDC